jgi:acyl-CoA reductase-like NAD-dependent aldehyde dehydrogenase
MACTEHSLPFCCPSTRSKLGGMSRTWTLDNPAPEEPFREVPVTGEPELAAIVARAHEAQRTWRRVPVEEQVQSMP